MKWRNKLKSESGASLAAALVIFLICSIGASMMLTAAMAFVRKTERTAEKAEERSTVRAAAKLLRDELTDERNVVKIKETAGMAAEYTEIQYYYVGADGDPDEEASWQEFHPDENEAVLDSLIQEIYTWQLGMTGHSEEKELLFSIEADGEEAALLPVRIWMCPDFTICAAIADEQETTEQLLTISAEVERDLQPASDSNGMERPENEDVQVTTVRWKDGVSGE